MIPTPSIYEQIFTENPEITQSQNQRNDGQRNINWKPTTSTCSP